MRGSTRFFWPLVMLAGLLLLSGVRYVYAQQQTLGSHPPGAGHEAPIEVIMTVPPSVALGQPMALTVDVMPLIDAPEVKLLWGLPPGVTLLDGPTEESLGAMNANQKITLVRQVRIDSPGVHRIGVHAGFQPNSAVRFGDASVFYFTVDDSGGSVSKDDPQRLARLNERIPVGPDASVVVAANASPDATTAFCVNITGRFMREDKIFDGTTYQTIIVPITGAVAEIWEDDVIFDDHYGTIMPDNQGNFGWTSCADDGFLGGNMEYYVKTVAKSDAAIDEYVVEVESAPPFFIDLPDIPLLYSDPIYSFESDRESIGDDVSELNFGTMTLNEEQSAPFNIAESIFEAWRHWNDNDGDPNLIQYDDVDVYWTIDDSYGSYYVGILDNLYLDGGDEDEWDDSAIIHEWTHFADDKWGCDDNPGGDHNGFGLIDGELAWGEGYPDFYQSVVRSVLGQPFANLYIDLDALSQCGVCIDIENWHTDFPGELHINNEISNAAALWDIFDAANEGLDTITLEGGHNFFGKTFMSSNFIDANIGYCAFRDYFISWASLGGRTDAAVAAAIQQNINIADFFGTAAASTTQQRATQALYDTTQDFRWWQRVAYIVDNSLSMADQRLGAIKTVLQEQVNDLFAAHPEGVEFRLDTFSNVSPANQTVFAGQYFPDDIELPIANLTHTPDPDGGACPVNAFGALQQSVANQSNLSTWLFTDNYPQPTEFPLESFRAELAARDITASFAVLQTVGATNCLGGGEPPGLAVRQKQLQRQLLFTAGPAPTETEPDNSIIPYLLTAQVTGGQFLFVEEGQMESAAEILQAQLSHNAGAGRWSDYVSLQSTYRYDELAPWEYEWVDATVDGTLHPDKPGGLSEEDFINVSLPAPFTFYSRTTDILHVYENGYITLGDSFGEELNNTELPDPLAPNAALYPYWDNLEWEQLLLAAAASQGDIYTDTVEREDGDWFVVEYYNYWSPTSNDEYKETFEVLLNLDTGEIRFQYNHINANVGGATIGLESWGDFSPVDGVQVAYNDGPAASSGMGYRFVPVPPQLDKTYSVMVDSTMESIGFLLTQFSGSLAPMEVRTPGDEVIDCNGSGVRCINVGNVQYVQVNVNERTGPWSVRVVPGETGSGTFSFASMAAGLLPATSPSDRTLPSFQSSVLLLDLGQPVDNHQINAQLLTPANLALGQPFAFYDDGGHGDGGAGDGLFGSDPIQPQQNGTGYLWVDGQLNGQPFRRVDSKPFSFQPIRLAGPEEAPSLEAKTVVPFTLYNDDTVDHVFEIEVQVPQGWRGELDIPGMSTVTVSTGQSLTFPVAIWMGATDQEALDQPTGATGTVNVAAIEAAQGALYDSASVQITRRRMPHRIEIDTHFPFLQVNSSAPIVFHVVDDQNGAVVDGTELALSATLGTLPPTVTTENGIAIAQFVAGGQPGFAQITAQTTNGVSATTTISITPPLVESIVLSATAKTLPANGLGTTPLVATVLDANGTPVANQQVRIGVEGGGDQPGANPHGTVDGSEVVSGTTNAEGEFVVTYTSGIPGLVGVRAELLNEGVSVRDDRVELLVGALFLPVIQQRPAD